MVRPSFSVTGAVVTVLVSTAAFPLLMTRVTVTAKGTTPAYCTNTESMTCFR